MVNLAQLFLPSGRRATLLYPISIHALCLSMAGSLLAGCDAEETVALRPSPVSSQVPAGNASAAVSDAPVRAPEHYSAPEPLAAWSPAESPADFHATWLARFELLASSTPEDSALLPYADALSRYGSSWGISPAGIEQVLVDSDGRPYRRYGWDHPEVPGGNSGNRPDPAWLDALGWTTLRTDGMIQLTDHGSGFRLVGPVVATPSCAACHAYTEGDVVGALVYHFSEIADD